MLFYDFEINDKAYKLRLNTRNIVMLEKQIGCNPLAIFGDGDIIPTINTMVTVLNASLQQYQHGFTMNESYDLFDEYLDSGHTVTDFIPVILEIYKVSGLIKSTDSTDSEESKN